MAQAMEMYDKVRHPTTQTIVFHPNMDVHARGDVGFEGRQRPPWAMH
jgi:hypothetical protein